MAIERIQHELEPKTERESELVDALKDMVWQFAYRNDGHGNHPPTLFTGGLSSLEWAFSTLGWTDPYPAPDSSCDVVGCQKWGDCGVPIPNGDYWSMCGDHMRELREGADLKKKRGRGYNAKQRSERLKRR